ncbi:hypothetical protein BSI_24290 [Bacillus inaquosorum KCTC 13429]|uniref:Uncharacterized protein n=1 Tax=Bacillus inaquosorum KCTC 13429 TaxID=1236548 RepID=A0A9W5LHW3_9BACI|nr:hypothetical protein BSI_24290 [Bacillus inaquosorum KCTC 13429]
MFEEKPALSLEGGFYLFARASKKAGIEPAFFIVLHCNVSPMHKVF